MAGSGEAESGTNEQRKKLEVIICTTTGTVTTVWTCVFFPTAFGVGIIGHTSTYIMTNAMSAKTRFLDEFPTSAFYRKKAGEREEFRPIRTAMLRLDLDSRRGGRETIH